MRAERQFDLSGLRVLVIDDERDAREVMRAVLASLGATVSLASSTSEALEVLPRMSFDVLVSDIRMAHMDGFSFIRAVRASGDAQTRIISAVALTAFAFESARVACIEAGFDAYVSKPFTLLDLAEGLRAAQAARQVRANSSA